MRVSRAFDHNLARRELRHLLLEIADALSLDEASVPHSFQTRSLLEFAKKLSQKRSLAAEPELREELLARTGIAACLNKDPDLGRTCFDRGLRSAAEGPDHARFLYLSGLYDHYHRGNYATAQTELEDALAEAELARRLRTEIRIALGRTCRRLGELALAEQHYQDVIELGVGEYRPVALHYLALVHLRRKDFPEANRLAQRALREANPDADRTLPQSIRSSLGDIAHEQGDLEKAARLYLAAVTELDRTLATHSAASTYNNLGATYRRLGQYGSALDAYTRAVRYYTIEGQDRLLSQVFRNIAICYTAMADVEAARGAYDRAIALAQGIGSRELELLALAEALEHRDKLKVPSNKVAQALGRCKRIASEVGSSLSGPALYKLASVALALTGTSIDASPQERPPVFGSDAPRLDRLVVDANVLDREFKEAFGPKLKLPHAPGREAIGSFLLLFTGDRFKHADYAGEFLLRPPHAKRHLKELRDRGVIELSGERKGAAYTLAFHRVN